MCQNTKHHLQMLEHKINSQYRPRIAILHCCYLQLGTDHEPITVFKHKAFVLCPRKPSLTLEQEFRSEKKSISNVQPGC